MDRKECVLLVLLDLSAAFDTVNHEVLLDRLHTRLGVSGVALEWLRSYLQDRTQSVHIDGQASPPHDLKYGVPQGSVLGPVLFTVYLSPLGDILRRHGIKFHLYADDSQLYLSFPPPSSATAVAQMERCIAEVRAWLARNFLQLNDGKTELLMVGSSAQLTKAQISGVTIGDISALVVPSARNLGAVLDSACSLLAHVRAVCQSARFHLRKVGRIRKYLDTPTARLVVHAMVTSRLDNVNALLHGLPANSITTLQRIQNSAARMVTRAGRYDSITPILQLLHWLPIHYRCRFKILTLTFKALHGQAPSYLRDMLTIYKPRRCLRSAEQFQLVVPRTRTNWGNRAFSVAAPALWNSLPLAIRQCPSLNSFQQQLKTYLFSLAFNV